jgi:hypothetical protein
LEDVVVTEVWPAIYDLAGTTEIYSFVKDVLSLDYATKGNSFVKR